MAVSITDVRALSPSGDFDCFTDASIQKAIDDAARTVEGDALIEKYRDPMIENLAAHLLTLRGGGAAGGGSGGGGGSGAVTSESAGGISRSYATASPGSTQEATYQSTGFGQEYLRLKSLNPLGALAACTQYGHLYKG